MVRLIGIIVTDCKGEKMRSSLLACCSKRKKSISVHWCWWWVDTWKREQVRGKKWSCWQALNVQFPHITLCILAISLLTGCGAPCRHSALEVKWQVGRSLSCPTWQVVLSFHQEIWLFLSQDALDSVNTGSASQRLHWVTVEIFAVATCTNSIWKGCTNLIHQIGISTADD